jgi:hypothetical protein
MELQGIGSGNGNGHGSGYGFGLKAGGRGEQEFDFADGSTPGFGGVEVAPGQAAITSGLGEEQSREYGQPPISDPQLAGYTQSHTAYQYPRSESSSAAIPHNQVSAAYAPTQTAVQAKGTAV